MKNFHVFSAYGFVIDDDSVWFVPYYYNYLCRYSLKDDRCLLCKRIPEDVELVLSFANLLKYNNQIILIPDNANTIFIYDIDKDEFDSIELDTQVHGVIDKYYGYALKKNILYMFGAALDDIIKIDLCNKSVQHLGSWKKDFHGETRILYFQLDYLRNDNYVYLLSKNSNEILRLNLDGDTFETISIRYATESVFSTICKISEGFFLTDEKGNGYIFDENFELQRKIEKSKEYAIQSIKGRYFACFMDSVYNDNHVMAFPGSCDSVVEFDLNNLMVSASMPFDSAPQNEKWSGVELSMIQQIGKKIYGFRPSNMSFFTMNIERRDIVYHYFELQLTYQDKIYELKKDARQGIIIEGNKLEDELSIFMGLV